MNANLPDNIMSRNEKGNLTEQKVSYEWKPTLCKHCEKYGHPADVCRKKKAEKPGVEKQDQQQKELQITKGSTQANPNSSLPGRAQVNEGTSQKKVNSPSGNPIPGSPSNKRQSGHEYWVTPLRFGRSTDLQNQNQEIASLNTFQVLNQQATSLVPLSPGSVGNGGQKTIPSSGNG